MVCWSKISFSWFFLCLSYYFSCICYFNQWSDCSCCNRFRSPYAKYIFIFTQIFAIKYFSIRSSLYLFLQFMIVLWALVCRSIQQIHCFITYNNIYKAFENFILKWLFEGRIRNVSFPSAAHKSVRAIYLFEPPSVVHRYWHNYWHNFSQNCRLWTHVREL